MGWGDGDGAWCQCDSVERQGREKTSLTPRDHELRYLSKLPHGEILVEDPVLSRPQARVDSLNPSLSHI